jgi:hypothetical protein
LRKYTTLSVSANPHPVCAACEPLRRGIPKLAVAIWFENSAHLPMTEEPGKFLVSLVRYARPITERAGDTAPSEH